MVCLVLRLELVVGADLERCRRLFERLVVGWRKVVSMSSHTERSRIDLPSSTTGALCTGSSWSMLATSSLPVSSEDNKGSSWAVSAVRAGSMKNIENREKVDVQNQ